MARKLIYSRRADADLDRLEAFIAAESPRQAERAIARIRRGLRSLQDLPELGKPLEGGYRQLVLRYRKSAYVVRYRVMEHIILITRIWHGKENR